jgi:hypothetical protein
MNVASRRQVAEKPRTPSPHHTGTCGTLPPCPIRLGAVTLIAFLALAWAGLPHSADAVEITRPMETDFVTLRAMSFEEARELLTPFLSENGRLGFAKTRRLLVIHDFPENIRTIRTILEKTDSDPVNIRIDIAFDSTEQTQYGGVDVNVDGVHVEHRDGHTTVRGNVTGRAGMGRSESNEFTNQFVMAGNGREARIWVGETVVDPIWVRQYGLRHGWWEKQFVETDLGASLWVRPTLLPDGTVDCEVYPKITARGEDGRRSIAVQELSTRVVAADGQTVSIGGLDRSRQEAYAKLFGIGRVFNGSSLAITLTPTVVRPPKPAAAPEQPHPEDDPAPR